MKLPEEWYWAVWDTIWDTIKVIVTILLFAAFVGACIISWDGDREEQFCLREETLRYVNGGHDVDTARWLAGTSGVCDR